MSSRSNRKNAEPIAIVGMGCRFAGASNLQDYWRQAVQGENGFSEIPADRWSHEAIYSANRRDADKSYAPRGGFIDDIRSFPAVTLQIPPRRVEVMDPQQRMSIEVALEAIEDAGAVPASMPDATGVFIGVTATEYRSILQARMLAQLMGAGELGDPGDNAEVFAAAVENVVAPRPYSAPGVLANMVACAVAQELHLHGPAYSVDAACSSALIAIYDAVNQLRAGSIDAALAGGTYLCLTPEHHVAFSRIGAMSEQGECLPFDARADGFVQGDGCGLVVLKRLSDAVRDGDRVYSVLHGIAANNDGGAAGPMAPVKESQRRVIERAWQHSDVDPASLGYFETHGTGTLAGDKAEFEGIMDSVGGSVKHAVLGSSKANVGHTMSAAGVAGVIRASLAIYHGTTPPMAGFESAKDDLGIEHTGFSIPQNAEPWKSEKRVAAISAFGFGGTNAHIVLEGERKQAVATQQPELIQISSFDDTSLNALAQRTADAMRLDQGITHAGVARTWANRRQQNTRVGIVASSREELIESLDQIAAGETPKNAIRGEAIENPKVAFLYPGQGAQRIGMLAGIRDRFPSVARSLATLEEHLDGKFPHPLTHYLYPELRAESIDSDAALEELTATEIAQPALYAVAASLTELLQSIGVRPVVTAGHSVGEFAAAVAAGLMSPEEGATFVAERGRAMATMTGDPGGMIALKTSADKARELLAPGAIVANINHPKQVVISGRTEAIDAVEANADAAGVRGVRLQVSHGFHSEVFDDLDLNAAVDAIQFSETDIPVASGIISGTYTDAETARDVFKRHATSPVDFVTALQSCAAAGADLYLQVAAGGPIATFAKRTLSEQMKNVVTLASNADDDQGASLLKGLGELWVRGVNIESKAFTQDAALESLPPSVLPKEQYWAVKDRAQKRANITLIERSQTDAALEVQSSDAPKTDSAKQPAGTSGIAANVARAVAKASAYPEDSLKPNMRLVEDLGFDSMMTADLIEELGRTVPGLGSIPREFFAASPTLGDLVEYCENPATDAIDASADDEPLQRFRPVWREAKLPESLTTRNLRGLDVLVTGDPELSAVIGRAIQRHRGDVTICSVENAIEVDAPDVVVFCASDKRPAPSSALLENGENILELPSELIRLAASKADSKPEFIVLTHSDNPWHEGYRAVARSLRHEWPNTLIKSLSFDDDATEVDRTERLCSELHHADQTVDVDWQGDTRRVLGFDKQPDLDAWTPSEDERTLISGGTSGIGLQVAKAIVARGGAVTIISRSEPSEAVTAWLAEHEGKASWTQADVTDSARMNDVAASNGPFTSLVHCAGVLADGPLGSVSAEQGTRARSVKLRGWLTAIAACGDSLKNAVALGSWAGRFGNRHQADYAAANAMMAASVDAIDSSISASVVEFGPWTSSEMAATIPEPIRNAMRSEGIDFVGDGPGVEAILESLNGESGVCVRGRRVPGDSTRRQFDEKFSLESHPFLADHVVNGDALVPFAYVIDRFSSLADDGREIRLATLQAERPIRVDGSVDVRWAREGSQLFARDADGVGVYFRGTIDESTRNDVPETYESGDAPTLSLDEFYETTFHGDMLRGIDSVRSVGSDGVSGTVHGISVQSWQPSESKDAQWTADPLAIDSAMQLAAIASIQEFGKVGVPLSIAESTRLRSFSGVKDLRADVTFSRDGDDKATLQIALRDADGPVYFARGIAVELIDAALARGVAESSGDAPSTETSDESPFEIKPEWTDVAQWPEYKDIKLRTEMVELAGLTNPYFDLHEGTARDTSIIAGKETINFSSYNYLGYSGDERVLNDVEVAVRKYGTSVSASRIASGERPFHRELEAELASANDVDDAIVFSGGHATNVNVIGHLFGPKDLILHDELIHDSCLQGIKLSGAARRAFGHDDPEQLEGQLKKLRSHYEKVLILIEGVYSMDGDIANAPAYVALKKKYGCLLMIDEAHSFGTIGPRGLGVRDYYDFPGRDVDIWMGTMSKSLASMGGWVAGRKELITYLRYTTPGFVFAAGIPPALGQAAVSSLRLMLKEPERVAKLQSNASYFYKKLQEHGIDTGPSKGESPVIPVITGDSMQALQLSQRLLDQGVNAKPIIYPAVADDSARLRFFLSSTHTEEQLSQTSDLIAQNLKEIREG